MGIICSVPLKQSRLSMGKRPHSNITRGGPTKYMGIVQGPIHRGRSPLDKLDSPNGGLDGVAQKDHLRPFLTTFLPTNESGTNCKKLETSLSRYIQDGCKSPCAL